MSHLLPLPITPRQFLDVIVPQAMALLPMAMNSPQARVMLLAICLQESNLADRRQGTESRPGPARGLAQFEVTGVRGVMNHVATQETAKRVCAKLGIPFEARAIHLAMEHNDVLAVAFARLLLWADPKRLPDYRDTEGAKALYLRQWRPGAATTPEGLAKVSARWRRHHPLAVQAVLG